MNIHYYIFRKTNKLVWSLLTMLCYLLYYQTSITFKNIYVTKPVDNLFLPNMKLQWLNSSNITGVWMYRNGWWQKETIRLHLVWLASHSKEMQNIGNLNCLMSAQYSKIIKIQSNWEKRSKGRFALNILTQITCQVYEQIRSERRGT